MTTAIITDAAEARLEQACEELSFAAERAAEAKNRCDALEDQRALIKADAIKRLMEAGVATSASAAEKIVERDELYMAHRGEQRGAEIERWRSLGQYEAAKARLRAVSRAEAVSP